MSVAGQAFQHCSLHGQPVAARTQGAVAEQQLLRFLLLHLSHPRVFVSYFMRQDSSSDSNVCFFHQSCKKWSEMHALQKAFCSVLQEQNFQPSVLFFSYL